MLLQGTPPPPVQISGTAISGAPITLAPPPPAVIDVPVLPPKKPFFLFKKKKTPLGLVPPLHSDTYSCAHCLMSAWLLGGDLCC